MVPNQEVRPRAHASLARSTPHENVKGAGSGPRTSRPLRRLLGNLHVHGLLGRDYARVRVVTHKSVSQKPRGRQDAKTSVNRSDDRYACWSSSGVFTPAPRFTGVDHGSDVLPRVETHTSVRPRPPGRLEKKNSSSPSERMFGRWSGAGLFNSVT